MSGPAPRPKFRESAAIVLVRGAGATREVFWVRRSELVSYMPGFFAFPGGSVHEDDLVLPVSGIADERERVLRACAIREAFEETGVLVALEPGLAAGDTWRARSRLLDNEAGFAALAQEHGWRFRGADLEFAGRWKTPPFSTARFDTSFFLVRAPEGQEPSVRAGELESGEWIAPAAALERWKRGRAGFAAPILHTLVELATGDEALADRLAAAPERSGLPVRRIELVWGIVLHPMATRPLPPATHTNCYLLGDREVAIVDPGSGDADELRALDALVELLRADGRTPARILLTHHHADHTGGVAAVRERYRLPVHAHAATGAHVALDGTLADGDAVALAGAEGPWTIRAIHTPGHARGHLCFAHDATRSLLTGDHVPGGTGTVIVDPPEGDMGDYVASLERLLGERVETLFPGHGSPQGAAHRRIRALIDHRRERERAALEALDREPRPLGALVERAYADVKRELWPYAERSLLAHLLDLERRGRAARDGERWRRA
jgi:endoribonuclease LACTB2